MSKIKFGLGALKAAQENYQIILDRLIRGYQKMMKKDPEGLDLIKIKQEAKQRAEDSAKVVDMEGKTLNPEKPIMGGTQDFGEDIRKIYDEAKGPGKGDEMVEALKSPGARASTDIIEKQIQETFPDIKLFGDETFEEILEIQKTGKHPRMKADGGRINFALGGPTNIIGAGLNTSGVGALGNMAAPGLGALGGIEEDEFEDIRGQTAGLGVLSTLNKILGPTIGQYVFNRTRDKVISKGIDVAENATRARRQAKEAAEALAKARVQSITAGYGGYDDSPGATGPTAAGAGMGVGGGYATDYFGADGGSVPTGLATMFTRKR